VRLVIADTGPINYLILIGQIEVLPRMFERVVLPGAVQAELSSPVAPPQVQSWIATPPTWLEVIATEGLEPVAGLSPALHPGEAAAIALAASLHADLLLIDERGGVRAAQRQGLRVTGTLGVLDLAAERGLLDFAQAIRLLEGTTFRRPTALLEALLLKHGDSGGR
jgi:predicted nucleic acid-binding protein